MPARQKSGINIPLWSLILIIIMMAVSFCLTAVFGTMKSSYASSILEIKSQIIEIKARMLSFEEFKLESTRDRATMNVKLDMLQKGNDEIKILIEKHSAKEK